MHVMFIALCAYQDGQTALCWAAEKGHTDIAVALLEKGAAMDVQDKVRGRNWAAITNSVCSKSSGRWFHSVRGVLLQCCSCRFFSLEPCS